MGHSDQAWLHEPAPVPVERILKTYSADIVILGAGHSGTAAARAAAESGASVLVVEQQSEDAFHALVGQVGTLNSMFIRERGVPDADPVDFIRDYQHRSLNRANPELIRQFAYKSGNALDWFLSVLPQFYLDHLEITMFPKPRYYTGELNGFRNFIGTIGFMNRPVDDCPVQPNLSNAIRHIHQQLKLQGVQFFYGQTGYSLIQNDGRVTGLYTKDSEGNYQRFLANKAVILAAGDFSGDKEMLLDLLDEYRDITQSGKRFPLLGGCWKGGGIKMGLLAGGHMEPAPRGGMWCCVAGNGGPMDGSAFLKLNEKGLRYTNEGIMGYWGAGLQGARQKGPIVTLWDSNWREELEYQSLDHSSVDVSADYIMQEIEAGLRYLLETGSDEKVTKHGPGGPPSGKRNQTFSANSLEDLATMLGYTGVDRERFLTSVARYNQFAKAGRDEDFAKDPRLLHPVQTPPFFGYIEHSSRAGAMMVTVAGLETDGDQRVLDDELDPIPGLYATGNCCGGRFPIMYTTPLAGISIGVALTLGREAGIQAASE